ncbi:hypothetical protein GCM10022248_67730 [Nonomuraea soli]
MPAPGGGLRRRHHRRLQRVQVPIHPQPGQPPAYLQTGQPRQSAGPDTLPLLLSDLLEDYRARGQALPGRTTADGRLIVNTYFLGLQLDAQLSTKRTAEIATASGLPIDDDAYLTTSSSTTVWFYGPAVMWQVTDEGIEAASSVCVSAC